MSQRGVEMEGGGKGREGKLNLNESNGMKTRATSASYLSEQNAELWDEISKLRALVDPQNLSVLQNVIKSHSESIDNINSNFTTLKQDFNKIVKVVQQQAEWIESNKQNIELVSQQLKDIKLNIGKSPGYNDDIQEVVDEVKKQLELQSTLCIYTKENSDVVQQTLNQILEKEAKIKSIVKLEKKNEDGQVVEIDPSKMPYLVELEKYEDKKLILQKKFKFFERVNKDKLEKDKLKVFVNPAQTKAQQKISKKKYEWIKANKEKEDDSSRGISKFVMEMRQKNGIRRCFYGKIASMAL